MVDWPHRLWSKPVSKPKCPQFVCLLRPGSEISTARWKAGSHFYFVRKKCGCFFWWPQNMICFSGHKTENDIFFRPLFARSFVSRFFFHGPLHAKRSRTLDSFLEMEFHTRNQKAQVTSFPITNPLKSREDKPFLFGLRRPIFRGKLAVNSGGCRFLMLGRCGLAGLQPWKLAWFT